MILIYHDHLQEFKLYQVRMLSHPKIFDKLSQFTQSSSRQLYEEVKNLNFTDEAQANIFNLEFEKVALKKCCEIVQNNHYQDLSALLETLFRSVQRKYLKISIVVKLMENILEFIGLTHLPTILDVFSQNIMQCGELDEEDQRRFLKIINHLLKRVSKTQDYHIRGKLHLALTQILPLCHESGFQKRSIQAQTNQIQPDNELYRQLGSQGGISYEFYQSFWLMQKYFITPNILISTQKPVQDGPIEKQQKQTNAVQFHLKRICYTLEQTIQYFKNNPILQSGNKFRDQPVKFLKIFNLLSSQLNDPSFRTVILLQALLFCFTLKNPSAKGTIILTQPVKVLVNNIEILSSDYLQQSASTIEEKQVYEGFRNFLKSELVWVQLKDNWKKSKQDVFKKSDQTIIKIKAGDIKQQNLEIHELSKKRNDSHKKVHDKLRISGSNLDFFLNEFQPPTLKTTPIIQSFSTFFSQVTSIIDNFDEGQNRTTEFDTRSQYNLFQWKAMRSLYRQNIKGANSIEKDGKYKDYRMLYLLHKKKDELFDDKLKQGQQEQQRGQIRKKIKIQ